MTQTTKKRIALGIIFVFLATIGLLSVFLLPSTQESSLDQEDVSNLSQEKNFAPLFFSTLTHMEGNWTQAASDLGYFKKQAGYLRLAMDLAEEYDAVLTFESEIPFTQGMLRFDDNVFQEVLDRGMGIGSHCDISPKIEFSHDKIIDEFQKRKDAVDALVDPLQNLGCSGGGGISDWYTGAVGAGFKYLDGTVGFHYLTMSESERPLGWTNRAILDEFYHFPAPWEEEKRFYLFRVSTASFDEDPLGELVISGGNVGVLAGLAEESRDCGNECELTSEDVTTLVEKIRAFAASRDTSRVAKMEVYIPSKAFDEPGMEFFFQEMQDLQEDGVIEWASQKEVYEAFLDWEQGT